MPGWEHGQWSPDLKGFYSSYALGYSKGTSKSYYAGDKDVDLDSVLPAKAVIGAGYDSPGKRYGTAFTGTFVRAKQAIATNRQSYTNAGTPLTDATVAQFAVPGYASFDLYGYWLPQPNLRLTAGLYNLGDKRYWDYASARSLQPSSPRDLQDIQLLTRPGRTAMVTLTLAY